MSIEFQIRIDALSTDYHRSIVDDRFTLSLQQFVNEYLGPQLDTMPQSVDGFVRPTFGHDEHCGPRSLVRDIFTLDIAIHGGDGVSEFLGDITYHFPLGRFSPRYGTKHSCWVWTPRRRREYERKMVVIQNLMDDLEMGRRITADCPICTGALSIRNDSNIFDVRCKWKRCFRYNYHKDEFGRLAHGHFAAKRPEAWA